MIALAALLCSLVPFALLALLTWQENHWEDQ